VWRDAVNVNEVEVFMSSHPLNKVAVQLIPSR
jgi:hypothetical protein